MNIKEMYRQLVEIPSSIKWFLLFVFVSAVVQVGLTAYILSRTDEPFRPVTKYEEEVYFPERAEYCPGDRMTVLFKFVNLRVPSVLRSYTTWYSIDEGRTVYSSSMPTILITTTESNNWGELSVVVPDLKPGRYEMRQAQDTGYTDPAVFTSPFVVPQTCFINQK